jgi:hypothetical protein
VRGKDIFVILTITTVEEFNVSSGDLVRSCVSPL